MKRLRKIIFWCHLPVGVIAGLVILLMSVTGVLLTYERQITDWADSHNNKAVTATPGTNRLPMETLLAKAREKQQITVSTITLRSDSAAPVTVGQADDKTVFINPYNGEIVGEGSQKARSFFRSVTDWHRWFGAQGESRATARMVTGACNLGFLFLVASGFYLWWPRKWGWSSVKNVVMFRRGLSAKARDFNWHNVAGFWSAVPLFIIVLSGVVMSYTWANNLVYRLAGEAPPAPKANHGLPQNNTGSRREGGPREGRSREAREDSTMSEAAFSGIDKLLSVAERKTPGWQSISLRIPESADAPAVFTIDRGNGGRPQKRDQLTLDRKTAEVIKWEPFSSNGTGRRIRSYLRFAHTGEVAGIAGQTIAGLASLGGTLLVWTGLALAFRRSWSWVSKRFKETSSVSKGSGKIAIDTSVANRDATTGD